MLFRSLSDDQRRTLVNEMLSEFDRFIEYNDVRITRDGDVATYRSGEETHRLFRVRDGAVPIGSLARGDTVFAETALAPDALAELRRRGVHWLDVGGKSRSAEGSSLTEELAGFLGRYGIRLPRD